MIGVSQGVEKAQLVFHAEGQGQLHGAGADSPRRHIDDPEEGRVVPRVQKQRHVGRQVLDFAPFEEALPADETIGNPAPAKVFFEEPGLGVHPVGDRELFPRKSALRALSGNFLDDKLSLPAIVGHGNDPNRIAAFLRAPKFFPAAI